MFCTALKARLFRTVIFMSLLFQACLLIYTASIHTYNPFHPEHPIMECAASYFTSKFTSVLSSACLNSPDLVCYKFLSHSKTPPTVEGFRESTARQTLRSWSTGKTVKLGWGRVVVVWLTCPLSFVSLSTSSLAECLSSETLLPLSFDVFQVAPVYRVHAFCFAAVYSLSCITDQNVYLFVPSITWVLACPTSDSMDWANGFLTIHTSSLLFLSLLLPSIPPSIPSSCYKYIWNKL